METGKLSSLKEEMLKHSEIFILSGFITEHIPSIKAVFKWEPQEKAVSPIHFTLIVTSCLE